MLYQTEIGKNIALSPSTSMRIESWEYNPKKNMMEVLLKTSGFDDQLSFSAVEKANPQEHLKVDTIYYKDDNYVVHINGISPEWGAVAIDIIEVIETEKEIKIEDTQTSNDVQETNETNETLIKTIYADQRKIKENKKLSVIGDHAYEMHFLDIDRKQLNKKINKYHEAIQLELEKQNEHLKEINALKAEQKYQTEIEMAETDRSIDAINEEIKQSKTKIESFLFEKNNAKEKLKKLKQKEKDLMNS